MLLQSNFSLRLTVAATLLAAAFCGCGSSNVDPQAAPLESQQSAWFADVAAESKLDFVHDPGPLDGEYFLPQINGSGAALFDYDNDGRLDVYLLQGGGPTSKSTNALFHQLSDGTFENASQDSGLDINGTNAGVAV